VSWREVTALVLLIAGGILQVLAVIGMLVMRDVYDRLHYIGLAAFGAFLIAVAIVFRESFSLIGDKALLVGLVLIVTGPILVQTTVRSFLIREHGDWRAKIPESAERKRR
jgi:multisubunit Na+/H+ antiporter MnhG subunit